MPTVLADETFHCAICGDFAGRIIVSTERIDTEGLTVPVPKGDGWLQARIEDLVNVKTLNFHVADGFPDIEVLRSRELERIFEHWPLWARFYCPQCDTALCPEHWKLQGIPGYTDTWAVCPEGHRHLVYET
jgi:hypothetical protein